MQAKLAVGSSTDGYEREADRAAEEMVRRLESRPRGPAAQASAGSGAEKPNAVLLSRLGASDSETEVSPGLRERIEGSRGGGQALPLRTQRALAPVLGRDLGHVRVHDGPEAHRMAHELRAQAFTVGRDIYFGRGKYAPGSSEGRRLLAHELAHTVQQGASNPPLVQTQLQDTAPSKPVSRPAKKKIRAVTLYRDQGAQGLVELELVAAPSITLEATYNGRPDPGTYELARKEDNHFEPVKQSIGGTRNDEGYVVKWVMPKDVTFEGVTSYTFTVIAGKPAGASEKDPAGEGAGRAKSGKGKGAKPTKPRETTVPTPVTDAKTTKTPPQTDGDKPASGAEAPTPDLLEKLKALPENIKALMGGEGSFRPEDYERLLKIGQKLQQLSPEDLELYKALANELTKDLDAFERSIDVYLQVKEHIQELARTSAKKPGEEPSLEEKLAKSWEGVDLSKVGTGTPEEKEALARAVAAKQRDIQLEHMVTHPGETAVGMVEGLVRPDQVAKGIAEDMGEALDGNKGGFARTAGLAGAYSKYTGYIAGVAGVVYIALLFVPGVNVAALATTALVAGGLALGAAMIESELRIRAAAEAKEPKEFMTHTEKAAAAQANVVVQFAMLGVHFAAKLVARIPLKGRYKTVGDALATARDSVLKQTGIGPAFEKIRSDLLARLKGAREGLPEALAEQTKKLDDVAAKVEGMTGKELLDELAAGDPALQDATGIPPETAKHWQEVAKTPAGAGLPDELRQNVLKGLEDAPKEAAKKVDGFVDDVDRAIEAVEKAKTPAELDSAIKAAEKSVSPEELAKKALADKQDYLKERIEAEIKGAADEAPTGPAQPTEGKQPAAQVEAPVISEKAPTAAEKPPPVAEQKPAAAKDAPPSETGEPSTSKEASTAKEAPTAEEKAPTEPSKAGVDTPEGVPPPTSEAAALTKLEKQLSEIYSKMDETSATWKAKEKALARRGDKIAGAKGKARKDLEKELGPEMKSIADDIEKLRKDLLRLKSEREMIEKQIKTLTGPKIKPGKIKPGSKGGPTEGEEFSGPTKKKAFAEDPTRTCVYCGREGMATDVDHAIPKTKGGNSTLENAQLACEWCNSSKGNRSFPVNPPPGYTGPWPPPWW